MTLATGTRLGPYEVVAPAGAGGIGEVYCARDTRLDRIVAIKVLPAHLSRDSDLKQRFEREARTISSLNHPHICQLYDVGSQDGTNFSSCSARVRDTQEHLIALVPIAIEKPSAESLGAAVILRARELSPDSNAAQPGHNSCCESSGQLTMRRKAQ